jgi:hypothetical protein
MKMDKELRIQLIDNRINILRARGEQMNAGIIAKLLRERRKLTNG